MLEDDAASNSSASSAASSATGKGDRLVAQHGRVQERVALARDHIEWERAGRLASGSRFQEVDDIATLTRSVAAEWGEDHAVRQQLLDNHEEGATALTGGAERGSTRAGSPAASASRLASRPGLPGFVQWSRMRREGKVDVAPAGHDELAAYYDWLVEVEQQQQQPSD